MTDPRAKLILQASLPDSVFSFEGRPDNYDKLVDNLTFGFVHDGRWNVHPRGLPRTVWARVEGEASQIGSG